MPRGQAEPLDIGPELRLAAGAGELQPRGQLPPRPGPGHRYDAVPSSLGGGTVPWGGGEEGEEEEEEEELRGRRRRRPRHGVRAQEGPNRCGAVPAQDTAGRCGSLINREWGRGVGAGEGDRWEARTAGSLLSVTAGLSRRLFRDLFLV